MKADLSCVPVETEQAKAERDRLATRIGKLEVAAVTHDRGSCVVGRAEWSLKGLFAANED